MFKLVLKYADKPTAEWKPLFYRILQSRITDFFRRQKIYNGIFFWKTSVKHDDEFESDLISQASDGITPERELAGKRLVEKTTLALQQLPVRQQQCFLLRSWEGLSVKQTALAMSCSEGSVKTHYSRAKKSLQKVLANE